MGSGESMPLSADMICIELMSGTPANYDEEFINHAANAVFYYFKHELGRRTVTLGEFAEALEKVLRGFKLPAGSSTTAADAKVGRSDLLSLAEHGDGCELFFFPRLRDELRTQLQQSPEVLRFSGLRGCVKRLAGAERWCGRCQAMRDRIVEFLRHCLSAEARASNCTLLVE
jgi:hypothetical protein